MTVQNVPSASIFGMALTFVISVVLPVGLFIYARKKFNARAMNFLIGCIVYLVIAKIFEPLVNSVVLSSTGSRITDNLALYAVYGGLFAAVFEEGGRLMALKSFVKERDEGNAFIYGIGQGGLEALLIGARPQISNILNSLLINNGMMQASIETLDAETAEKTFAAIAPLWQTGSITYILAGFERAMLLALNICFSLLMFYYIKNGSNRYIKLAYAAHFLANACSIILMKLVGVVAAETGIALITAAVIYITVNAHRTECRKEELVFINDSSDIPAEEENSDGSDN